MVFINEIYNLMIIVWVEYFIVFLVIVEFIQMYKQVREDSDDVICEFVVFIVCVFQEYVCGWLDDDDMIILLEGQCDFVRLCVNNV